MSTSTSLFVVVLLLAANGFFVAAEFALVKARAFRIESLAAGGSASAALTLRIQANVEAYLAACQLGITIAYLIQSAGCDEQPLRGEGNMGAKSFDVIQLPGSAVGLLKLWVARYSMAFNSIHLYCSLFSYRRISPG